MTDKDLELQEKIRKLAIKIVKHYRGKGPDNVKIKIEDQIITIEIRGVFFGLIKDFHERRSCQHSRCLLENRKTISGEGIFTRNL